MMAVLGSIALTRNKLWLYNEQLSLGEKTKPFGKTYSKWVEFTDAMAQQVSQPPAVQENDELCERLLIVVMQVLEYNTSLVATVVLNDPEGGDWSNSKPFMDGESVSSCIRFWWYHMQVCHILK